MSFCDEPVYYSREMFCRLSVEFGLSGYGLVSVVFVIPRSWAGARWISQRMVRPAVYA
jgi:hypothetical protein